MLYIANCTKQNLNFQYRLPELPRSLSLKIDSGRQEAVGNDWSPEQQQSVIEQMELYGFRLANDARGQLENFSGVLYTTNSKPVGAALIEEGHEKLVDHQKKVSAQESIKAALGHERVTRKKGGKDNGARLASVTGVEVIQDIGRGEKATGDEVNFSLTVAADGGDLKMPE